MLFRSEEIPNGKGGYTAEYIPATVDLSATKEEVRAGDRLLPAPARPFLSYTPRAPEMEVDARVVSIYGSSAVAYAAQNQVVAINMGSQDGLEPGHVLSLLTKGDRIKDMTDSNKAIVKLPSEVNGTAMVFRTFDNMSYAIVMENAKPIRAGYLLANPDSP